MKTVYRVVKFLPKTGEPFYIVAELDLNIINEKTGEATLEEWREALITGESISDIFDDLKLIQFALAQPPMIFNEEKNTFEGEEDIQEYTKVLKKLSGDVAEKGKVTFGHH